MTKINICSGFMVFGIILFFWGTNNITSQTGFCIFCHSMEQFHFLRKDSVHLEKRGNQIQCVDCHLPANTFQEKFHKLRSGVNNVYKTIVSEAITLNYFDKVSDKRHEFVFDTACLKCHASGLESPNIPKGVADIHRHVMFDSDIKMHCVDCHGGMEHGRKSVFNWANLKRIIYAEKSNYPKENQILEDIVNKTCIACHLKGGNGLGNLAVFDFQIQPSNYLSVKVGILLYDMPPTPTLRKYAVDSLTILEKMIGD